MWTVSIVGGRKGRRRVGKFPSYEALSMDDKNQDNQVVFNFYQSKSRGKDMKKKKSILKPGL